MADHLTELAEAIRQHAFARRRTADESAALTAAELRGEAALAITGPRAHDHG